MFIYDRIKNNVFTRSKVSVTNNEVNVFETVQRRVE